MSQLFNATASVKGKYVWNTGLSLTTFSETSSASASSNISLEDAKLQAERNARVANFFTGHQQLVKIVRDPASFEKLGLEGGSFSWTFDKL